MYFFQVDFFHSKDIRVLLWATSIVNIDSSNYQEAYNKEYFMRFIIIIGTYSVINNDLGMHLVSRQ